MSWELVKSESFILPRAKALEFAAENAGLPNSPVERELDQSRVKKPEAILRNKLAIPLMWAKVMYKGQYIRMNGRNSSTAIVQVGPEVPEKLAFHMDEYRVSDGPEGRGSMVELFRQFDQRWSARTSKDVAGAFQGLVPEIAPCNKTIMKLAAEAMSWCKGLVLKEDVSRGDDAYDLMHDAAHTPFLLWVNGIINNRKELMRKEVMAAMWRCHAKSPAGATKFWRGVSFGAGYYADRDDDHDPAGVLIGELTKADE